MVRSHGRDTPSERVAHESRFIERPVGFGEEGRVQVDVAGLSICPKYRWLARGGDEHARKSSKKSDHT